MKPKSARPAPTKAVGELARLLEPARRALADEEAIARSVRLARARTLSGAAPRATRRTLRERSRTRVLALATATAALSVAAALLARSAWHSRVGAPPSAIAFAIAGTPGVVGERQVATSPRTLQFDDGTQVALEPGGVLRVLTLDERGGRLLVEQGAVHAAFQPRARARWTVEAGGVVVEVTGTRFDVSFDPTTQAFELVMQEGSVRIHGCGLGEDRVATGTQSVRASCASDGALAVVAPPALGASAPRPDVEPAPVKSVPAETVAPPREPPSLRPAAPVDGSMDLLAEADASRRAGHTSAARATLLELRTRFPRGRGAPEAAFDLGVLAFDVDGHYGDAAGWFRHYLDESPDGPLAREALGRVMEAQSGDGDAAGAAATAARYLEFYPGGPHAVLAKRLAGRP